MMCFGFNLYVLLYGNSIELKTNKLAELTQACKYHFHLSSSK